MQNLANLAAGHRHGLGFFRTKCAVWRRSLRTAGMGIGATDMAGPVAAWPASLLENATAQAPFRRKQDPFDYWPWLASTLLQPWLIFARFACRQPEMLRTSLGFLCNSARQNLLTS
jgi:hypothetical protein